MKLNRKTRILFFSIFVIILYFSGICIPNSQAKPLFGDEIVLSKTGSPKEFSKVTRHVQQKNTLMRVAEQEVLGYTHAEIGKLLGERWNLPPKLISVIGHHHNPGAAGPYTVDAAIIHLADIFGRALNIGSGGDHKIPPLDEFAWEILRIRPPDIEPILEGMKKEFDDISLFITYTP